MNDGKEEARREEKGVAKEKKEMMDRTEKKRMVEKR